MDISRYSYFLRVSSWALWVKAAEMFFGRPEEGADLTRRVDFFLVCFSVWLGGLRFRASV